MAIQKVVNTKEKPLPILEEVGKLSERVRRRAFDLFEQRGHELGRPLDDWLKRNGDSGLAGRGNGEKGGQYQLQLTLPGSLQRGVPGLARRGPMHLVQVRENDRKKRPAKTKQKTDSTTALDRITNRNASERSLAVRGRAYPTPRQPAF